MRIRTTLIAVALATTALLGGSGAAAAEDLPLFSQAADSGPGAAGPAVDDDSKGDRAAVAASDLDPTPGGVLSRLMGA
ncbi:hypothetical protein FCH28_30225 [Streptomyces piniterrae]|uniref:ATP-binding protein n=1 Tax=Streptomyces piniterrae TaxID=2571125 RepID=A0A4U0MUA1_9ACTN|nr:hypothetical protein [Streptomyces piniterrae]TJZ44601.1 hypothetical protein FCH28_30225 [Streptomyces piniterrae]